MAEGQIGLIDFVAESENDNAGLPGWGNTTNIQEVLLELETRDKKDAGSYDEESRWIVRVVTSTLYDKIKSVRMFSPTIPLVSAQYGITGHFNGGDLINIKTNSSFNSTDTSWQLIQEGLTPDPSIKGGGIVSHNMQWCYAADTWFDQTWGVDSTGGRLNTNTESPTESYVKDCVMSVETRKKADGDGTQEECRFIAKLIIAQEGKNITNIATISNAATGALVLGYPYPGSPDVIQWELDPTWWGAKGFKDVAGNTKTGAWTLIRQSFSANGPQGTKIFAMESHWVSPSLWFPAEWTKNR